MLYKRNMWALRMEEKYGALMIYNATWRHSVREIDKQMWALSIVYPIIVL
jgi:hypothetical protein